MSLDDPTATTFDQVPLPAWPPGGQTSGDLARAVAAWASSPPIRALAEACRWSDKGGLRRLVELSDTAWDFRRQRERNLIADGAVVVDGTEVPEPLILGAADALGLVHATRIDGRFSHLVVLGGLVPACVNRAEHAARLQDDGPIAGEVVVLTGHRSLGGDEPAKADARGLGEHDDESAVATAAARQALGVAGEPTATEGGPATGPTDADLRRAWSVSRWPGLEVVVAPSGDPEHRRVNTADQLAFWSDRAGIGPAHHVLLVTTQIYVPYQHFEAIRVLGVPRGCGVTTCGVDAAHAVVPLRAFGGRDYLQEVRSALHAADRLLTALA